MLNSFSRVRHNRLTVFWKNSVGDIGSVIRVVYTEAPVCPSSLEQIIANTVIDIVHAVSYSLLLLNTDLHVAELTTRMSRNQFVRNTITAVQTQLQPSPSAQTSSTNLTNDDGASSVNGAGSDGPYASTNDTVSRSKRSDSITSWNSISRETIMSSPALSTTTTQVTTPGGHHSNGSTPSVQISTSGHDQKRLSTSNHVVYGRAWENEMETLLKVSALLGW